MLFSMTNADQGEGRGSEGVGWPSAVLMMVACLIGLLDIVLVTVGNDPVTPRLTQSEYVLIPIVERVGSGDADGKTSALLSTNFTMKVPKRIKGQKVEISKVAFFSENDAPLGSANVSHVTMAGTGGLRIGPATGQPVVPPLNEAEISFRATLRDTSGLAPGTKIYTQVEGIAGNTNFKARSRPSATTGGEV
jgi:hypothetical protein